MIICGELVALSVMVTAAVTAPAAVGAKWPWMEQLAPTARLAPQLLAKAKEEVFVPVTVMLEMDNAAVPELVIVTDCDALMPRTFTVPKDKLVDERVGAGIEKRRDGSYCHAQHAASGAYFQ